MKCKYLKLKTIIKLFIVVCLKKKFLLKIVKIVLIKKMKKNEIKRVSKKLVKKENKRFFAFYNDFKKCSVCGNESNIAKHEIFAGRNRQNSIKYRLVISLCFKCHEKNQSSGDFNNFWFFLQLDES